MKQHLWISRWTKSKWKWLHGGWRYQHLRLGHWSITWEW